VAVRRPPVFRRRRRVTHMAFHSISADTCPAPVHGAASRRSTPRESTEILNQTPDLPPTAQWALYPCATKTTLNGRDDHRRRAQSYMYTPV